MIYGVVLLEYMDDFIDLTIINIFLSKNPVPTILANVYYYHHVRHEKKKGMIMCCVPFLYTWVMSHMPRDGPFIEEYIRWPHKLASLSTDYAFWIKWEWE